MAHLTPNGPDLSIPQRVSRMPQGTRDLWQRWLGILLCYVGLAAWLTWPALLSPAEIIPGAERTDLWNSLWSFWWASQGLGEGLMARHTSWLDHPDGGELMVSDPVGVPAMALMQLLMPLSAAYTCLIVMRLALSGLVVHAFCEEWLASRGHTTPRWGGAAWIAGVGYETAPLLTSAVHNGASEAVSAAWVPLAVWLIWRAARLGGPLRLALAVLSLVMASLASWYGAVVAFLFATSLALLGVGDGMRQHWKRRSLILLAGVILVAPLGASVKAASQGEDNLVLIKDSRELSLVRRSTGAADPMALVRGGDFRSPDFRKLSRYGENFFHCSYLGWVLILLALCGLCGRRRGGGFLWLGGGAGLLMALGPVLVRDAAALVVTSRAADGVLEHRAFPMPYYLVEGLPGFDSLSLVYRLVQAPALALALLAAAFLADRRRLWVGLTLAAVLVEARFVAPTQATTGTVDARLSPRLEALADAPSGAVMNFPVVGGRAYLYEQTLHGKAIAGTLNFPNNLASRKVWKSMTDHIVSEESGELDHEAFRLAVVKTAKKVGVRYVVVHVDSDARPDMHDEAVRVLREVFDPLEEAPATQSAEALEWTVEVFQLW